MTETLSPLLLLETALFVAAMALARNKERPAPGEYVGTLFHQFQLPPDLKVPRQC